MTKLVEALRYKPQGRGFEFPMVSLRYLINLSFRKHYGPGVVSPSYRNEEQRCFLWGERRPVRMADDLTTFICRLSRNFVSLNLLEP
jgi:hypothetical protein